MSDSYQTKNRGQTSLIKMVLITILGLIPLVVLNIHLPDVLKAYPLEMQVFIAAVALFVIAQISS